MVEVGHGIVLAVLLALGMINPQVVAPSDPANPGGDGKTATPAAVQYLPAGADAVAMLNVSPAVFARMSDLWLKQVLTNPELLRTIGANMQGDFKAARDLRVMLGIYRQIRAIEPREIAAAAYLDADNRALRILAAFTCGRPDQFNFVTETLGVVLEGDRKAAITHRGEWSLLKPAKLPEGRDFLLAFNKDVFLVEFALHGPVALIDRVCAGGFPPLCGTPGFPATALAARGDSGDALFAAIDFTGLTPKLARLPGKGIQQLVTIANPAGLGQAIYTMRPEGAGFRERFAVIAPAAGSLIARAAACSKPLDRRILALAPAGAVAVQAGGFDAARFLTELTAALQADQATAGAARTIEGFLNETAAMGIDLRGKVVNNLEGSGLFFVTLPEGGLPMPGFGLILETRDAQPIMEILELLQNDDFRLSKRDIAGTPVFTSQIKNIRAVVTFGPVGAKREFMVVTSSPELFAAVAAAAADPAPLKFADPASAVNDMLLYQFINTARVGGLLYTLGQPPIARAAERNPLLKGLNPAALPAADVLFGQAPPIISVTTRATGTVTLSPFPITRLLMLMPAALPIAGNEFMRGINGPAIRLFEEEKEFQDLQKKNGEKGVDIF
ncbi:MAG: hypothetical protein ABIF71_14205 [Planctomycetota bacterium]